MAKAFDFEAALREFCLRWSEAVKAGSPIVGGRLFHKTVNCQVAGGPAFAVTFAPGGAELRAGSAPGSHATLSLAEDDWRGILSGRYSLWSVQLAGRQRPTIEEDALLRQLGLIMQSFALRKPA
ncbi:MAG TPA: hypothetical protein VFT91_04905 [Dehalococcoidia bacterium]|nr:hypothetical protein [Dehalococcoidia bacterium]